MKTILLCLSVCIFTFANAQKQPLQSKEITATLEKCYDGELTAKQLAEKEFRGISFRLDLDKNILYRLSNGKEKSLTYIWNQATGDVNITDCSNCGELKLQMKRTADGIALIARQHNDDCFTFLIAF